MYMAISLDDYDGGLRTYRCSYREVVRDVSTCVELKTSLELAMASVKFNLWIRVTID